MNIVPIKKTHKTMLINFIKSLDDESLKTYTRWRLNFVPDRIADNIISENELGSEIGWIILSNDQIVGYEHLNFKHDFRSDIVREGFIVHPQFSGQGIGSILKQKCIEEAKICDLHKIIALIYEDNWSSLHIDLKNDFCIAGIFYNEEKISGKPRYVIYLERSIKENLTQEKYFSLFEETNFLFQNIKKNSDFSHSSILHTTIMTRNEFLKLYEKNKKTILKNLNKDIKTQQLFSKIPSNSTLVVTLTEDQELISFLSLESFTEKEKSHVSRIQITEINKNISNMSYLYIIHESLNLSKKMGLEKIWITVPETNFTLIKILNQHEFVLEAISMNDLLLDNKPVNLLSFAFHFTNNVDSSFYLETMKKLVNKFY